jgi:imidazole glycerol-phosphate synthase subunit HisH
MIRIVDYGLGNLLAFKNAYRQLGIEAELADSADKLSDATKIILPGVGAFDHAMALLNQSGMREVLDTLVVDRKVPVLGICVGMQILANGSDEGSAAGLGWISGSVTRFKSTPGNSMMLPHMGWNDVEPKSQIGLFSNLSGSRFYFLHSYHFQCEHSGSVIATSNYGGDFACGVAEGNVYGVQFHPEKSHHYGVQLLKNFSEL